MPTLVDALPAAHSGVVEIPAHAAGQIESFVPSETAPRERDHVFAAILTTSVCLHLLLVGYLGHGLPAEPLHRPATRVAPPPPPIVENVQLEAPPPPQAAKQVLRNDPPPPEAQDLPVPAAVVSAVPANVAVAFAVKVAGPVRLVADAGEAGGGEVPPALPSVPVEAGGRSLLTDPVVYPAVAIYRHLTGRVIIEFHTTATGDIVDVRVRSGSGYDVLDRAAMENLRLGRWVGEAGYFTKTYDFVLH